MYVFFFFINSSPTPLLYSLAEFSLTPPQDVAVSAFGFRSVAVSPGLGSFWDAAARWGFKLLNNQFWWQPPITKFTLYQDQIDPVGEAEARNASKGKRRGKKIPKNNSMKDQVWGGIENSNTLRMFVALVP